MNQQNIHSYDDIIHLSRPISKKHPQMPIRDRAAQFAPFAALTGHKEAISETERLTDAKRILLHIKEQPKIRVTYFKADERKEGGAYLTLIMNLKRIDDYNRRLIFSDHSWIPLDDIYEIELIGR